MADKLVLSCLIEGWNEHFQVYVSYGNSVDALRESISQNTRKDWNQNSHTLSLLKVNLRLFL